MDKQTHFAERRKGKEPYAPHNQIQLIRVPQPKAPSTSILQRLALSRINLVSIHARDILITHRINAILVILPIIRSTKVNLLAFHQVPAEVERCKLIRVVIFPVDDVTERCGVSDTVVLGPHCDGEGGWGEGPFVAG